MIGWLDAIILGVVEGLTEFLPVSSTGHLILSSQVLGLGNSNDMKTFQIAIQAGAIFAVIWHYRQLLLQHVFNLFQRNSDSKILLRSLIVAFIPAAVVGLFSGN